MSSSSSLKSLPIFLSTDNLIRLRGRLNNLSDEDMSIDSKNPIILDKDHLITYSYSIIMLKIATLVQKQ